MKKTIFTLSLILSAYILKAQVLYGTASGGGTNNGGAIVKLVTGTDSLTAAFSLEGSGGIYPYSSLIQASDGKLYGMTYKGGSNNYGTVFSYDPATSAYTKLKDFDNTNGAFPEGSLIQALDGKLYGMTSLGGDNNYGVIFSYDPATSTYIKLVDFDNTNGADPRGSLMQASDGKLYGMTVTGGSNDYGVIFSFDPSALTYTVLKEFDYTNGAYPFGNLMQASDGKLYGMTRLGGSYDYGVIFSFEPATSAYAKLKDFDNTNGAYPEGSLMQALDGKLYGMTNQGGNHDYGVIFSFKPSTSTYTKLKDFNDTDGANPYGNNLIQASDGKLYAMTPYGGSNGYGVIFSYDPATVAYAKLKDFDNTNGASPYGSLIQASDGKLYAMTLQGGSSSIGVIFSYEPSTSVYAKLKNFYYNTGAYPGSLIQASGGKLYGMTFLGGSNNYGAIFSYDPSISAYTILKDFDNTNGAYPHGNLIQASDGKLYGMTNQGGANDYGVIFSYDPATSAYAKLKDFDYTNGFYPRGSLIQASDGKLYGMTTYGGRNGYGVIFSYDPATSVYKKLKDFDDTNGAYPYGSLLQASDGKLYGMTTDGGSNRNGVIFSYDPSTSAYIKLKDFGHTDGSYADGNLIQASDGKLYGMTSSGGSNDYGVIFSYEPSTSAYAKLKDFNYTNGAYPRGSLMQASDGKLYGMTGAGGSNGLGVAFSYDILTSSYIKLSDFTGGNGSSPDQTSFTEIAAGGIQISVQDKSVIEGDKDRKLIFVPVTLSEAPKKIIRVKYTTQNNTAKAGSDYTAQSGTLVFPPGLKRIQLPIRIIGDQIPEAKETFRIILSHPVNATIADDTAIITIADDDASALYSSKAMAQTMPGINLSPNPAQDKVKIILTGFTGNVVIQLSSFDGRILQQQKLKLASSKPAQQQLNVSSYANGIYLVTVIDEKGNRRTGKLVINR